MNSWSSRGKSLKMQIAFLIIPRDDLGAWAFLGVLADPGCDLVVCCAGGDARPELVVINLSEL